MNTKIFSIFSENPNCDTTVSYEKYNELIQDVAILMLTSLTEMPEIETNKHISKTQHYIKLLAEQVQNKPHFSNISTTSPELLFKSAPLHDIGKAGIPTYILNKRTPLTSSEAEIMKTHTILGCIAIENAQKQLNLSFPFLELAKEMALWHHERWDGRGYPHGLSELEIPDSARLMAVVDTYDALTTTQRHQGVMTHLQALNEIKKGSGSHFDPIAVEALLAVEQKFNKIALQNTVI